MASFRRLSDDDPSGHMRVELVQADPLIEISGTILENADGQFVSYGDGIVTFHCTNAEVSYGLHQYDDLRETWLGLRAGVDPEEVTVHMRGGV